MFQCNKGLVGWLVTNALAFCFYPNEVGETIRVNWFTCYVFRCPLSKVQYNVNVMNRRRARLEEDNRKGLSLWGAADCVKRGKNILTVKGQTSSDTHTQQLDLHTHACTWELKLNHEWHLSSPQHKRTLCPYYRLRALMREVGYGCTLWVEQIFDFHSGQA